MNRENEVLHEVLTETLENFAFLFSESVDQESAWPDGVPCMRATIAFRGEGHQGELALVIPVALCREMAANILGIDQEEATDSTADDAVKELTNVVAGGFAARNFGKSVVFDLGAPESEILSSDEVARGFLPPGAIAMQVDAYLISAVVSVRADAGGG
jgi:hypothetical protein